MEQFDPSLASRVWKRVGECPRGEQEDLQPLLLAAWEAGAVYRILTGQLTGKQRQLCQNLYDRAVENTAMLKGIQRLRGGEPGNPVPCPVQKENPRRMVERSYHRTNRLRTEYMARTLDPEVGTVFQILADRQREDGAALARLLGSMENR